MEEELEKLKGDKKLPISLLIKRIFKYVYPELKFFIIALVLLFLNVALDLSMPLFISNITDELKETNIVLSRILFLAISYLVIGILNQGVLFIESMVLQHTGQRIIYNLRMEVYTHIINMSQNQFNEMPVGSLVTRVASYTASLSNLFTNVLVTICKDALTVIGVYGIMIYISPKLSLLLSAFVVVVFVSSYFFGKMVGKMFRKERRYVSDLNTFLNENLSGMKITQIFNQQKRKMDEFDEKNKQLEHIRFRVTMAFGVYRPFVNFLYVLSLALTLYVGIMVSLSAGSIVGFYFYLSKFFNPIQNLADQLNNIQRAFTDCERLFNLLDVLPEVLDKNGAVELGEIKGHIEFKHVWFAYEKEDWILKDVSFEILPGQTAAFVGATGAGKTTILSLIVRNYEVQKGEILIDGINVNDIKIKSLRKAVGQMLQDVFLFSGNIRTNITLHDENFTEEEIKKTCEYVNANTFIDKLEKGLDEEVIERGENLSQGERQLLSFARTVLHKPELLILDEATANIDTETEKVIQDSLEKIKNIGTMLVVAHRLSTIQHADKIIVLKKGEILEQGTHQELLKNRGQYFKLYQLQMETVK